MNPKNNNPNSNNKKQDASNPRQQPSPHNPPGEHLTPSASGKNTPPPGSSLPEGRCHFGIPYVADYLGISRRSVQRLIDRGALPNCMDFSQPDSSRKLMRIPRESIIAYMAKMNRDRPDDPKE